MYALKITYFGKIEKLNNRTDLVLLTDSQEVNAVKEFLAGNNKKVKNELSEYNLFFVKVSDGDYVEIYASPNSVAWLFAPLDKIEIVQT